MGSGKNPGYQRLEKVGKQQSGTWFECCSELSTTVINNNDCPRKQKNDTLQHIYSSERCHRQVTYKSSLCPCTIIFNKMDMEPQRWICK